MIVWNICLDLKNNTIQLYCRARRSVTKYLWLENWDREIERDPDNTMMTRRFNFRLALWDLNQQIKDKRGYRGKNHKLLDFFNFIENGLIRVFTNENLFHFFILNVLLLSLIKLDCVTENKILQLFCSSSSSSLHFLDLRPISCLQDYYDIFIIQFDQKTF